MIPLFLLTKAAPKTGHFYESPRLRADVEIVWTAVRGIGDALAFADAKLRGNKPLVLEAFGRCFVEKCKTKLSKMSKI